MEEEELQQEAQTADENHWCSRKRFKKKKKKKKARQREFGF